MQRVTRSGLLMCVLMWCILMVVVAVADVTVEPNELQVGDLELKDNGGSAYIKWNSSGKLYFYNGSNEAFNIENGNARFDDDLTVENDLTVEDSLIVDEGVLLWDTLVSYGYTLLWDDLEVTGKIDSNGGYDPPYVLYDPQSRDQVVDRIKLEVSPAKQAGAALFFNKETKRLETYVASEGKFYDLQGTLLQTLPAVVKPDGHYETTYYLEKNTGQIQSRQRKIKSKFVIKEGIELDRKTGRYVSAITGQEVTRDQALEWYSAQDKTYYDTQGNSLRAEINGADKEDVTEYRFDRKTGRVEIVRKTIEGRYEIKEGYRFDSEKGQFVEDETGQNVSKEQAVKFVTASDRAQRNRNQSK